MDRSGAPAEDASPVGPVVHAQRPAPFVMARSARETWIEGSLWALMIALLSPLLIYYRSGVMPLPALFGIAAGIALGLALTGRRLHQSLLDDALSGRQGRGRFLMTFGFALLLLFLVLLGGVVSLVLLLRKASPGLPI
jgi:hypothetical protein